MARSARSAYISPDEKAIIYTSYRTSQSVLLGHTGDSGLGVGDRRVDYIEGLIRRFALFFGITVHAHAVTRDEIRLILESCPERIQLLDDAEIARRWLCICPTLRLNRNDIGEPTPEEIFRLCSDSTWIADIRRRLSDISWWMRLLGQRVAQHCNLEDKVKGRFWNGRYRSVTLLDAVAHLAALIYVDLALVCIDSKKNISASTFTSLAYRRSEAQNRSDCSEDSSQGSSLDAGDGSRDAGHLCPVPSWISHPPSQPTAQLPDCCDNNAQGCEEMQTSDYHGMLRWFRQELFLRSSGGQFSGSPDISISRLLQNLRLTRDAWLSLASEFDELFSLVAGRLEVMDAFKPKSGSRRAYVRPAAREVFRKCRLVMLSEQST